MKKKFGISLVVVLVLGTAATLFFRQKNAEAAPSGYEIGATVADFRLKNVNGNNVALGDFKGQKGLIVVFTCNHCPFAKAYEDRVLALDKKYAVAGFPVLAINSNDVTTYEEDSFDNMKTRAKEKQYSFPYLFDETQTVAKTFGATRTPHVYVLKNEGGKFTVQYIGTIDDNAQDPAGVTKRYVEDAVNNLSLGKPVITTITKAVGCAIRWRDA